MASIRSMQDQLAIVSQLLVEMVAESEESNDVALSDSGEYYPFTEQKDLPKQEESVPKSLNPGSFMMLNLFSTPTPPSPSHMITAISLSKPLAGDQFCPQYAMPPSWEDFKWRNSLDAQQNHLISWPSSKPPSHSIHKASSILQATWKLRQLTEFPPPPKPPDVNLILPPPSDTNTGSSEAIVLSSCVAIMICTPHVWENVCFNNMFGNIESLSTLLDLCEPLTITSILQCLFSQQAMLPFN
ncbi:hypothetical protein TSUD_101490 [Trifolium subterraneum]|uniref:Uncharacterized protein n=1 Tax=Trifolium subterraneum TaxID=3900 RepID=A0A2Z6MKF3_TRISU|nr:hypothetical protein TSUD_101490 [Trifolium subterraneum]